MKTMERIENNFDLKVYSQYVQSIQKNEYLEHCTFMVDYFYEKLDSDLEFCDRVFDFEDRLGTRLTSNLQIAAFMLTIIPIELGMIYFGLIHKNKMNEL